MNAIQNPVILNFVPALVFEEENRRIPVTRVNEELDIPLKRIFDCPLRRTIWLALKSSHLTNQYFRRNVDRVAQQILAMDTPLLSNQLFRLLNGGMFHEILIGQEEKTFHKALYPYVLGALIEMDKWPWIIPKFPDGGSVGLLHWRYIRTIKVDEPHAWVGENNHLLPCKLCHQPESAALHQIEG